MTASIGHVRTEFFEYDDPANPLRLLVGQAIPRFTLAYETYGRMNADRSNVVLVYHAMTGSQHAAGINTDVPGLDGRWTDEVHEGWWDGFIGPGKAVDTRTFCVVGQLSRRLLRLDRPGLPSTPRPARSRLRFRVLRMCDIVDAADQSSSTTSASAACTPSWPPRSAGSSVPATANRATPIA